MQGPSSRFRWWRNFAPRILGGAVLAALLLPVVVLVSLASFSRSLTQDLESLFTELQTEADQSREVELRHLLRPLVRQKLGTLTQELSTYLENRGSPPWEEIARDQRFRELLVTPLGLLGEVFLVTLPDKKVLWHCQKALEGLPLEQALAAKLKFTGSLPWQFVDHGCLQEFFPKAGKAPGCGYLMPLTGRPAGGPELLVGVWVNFQELDLLTAHSQAIFQKLRRSGRDFLQTGLDRFWPRLLPWLGALGVLYALAGVLLARQFKARVNFLTKAVQTFTQGDMSHRLLKPPQDELGRLAQNLNTMVAEIHNRTVSRTEWENTFNSLPDLVLILDREGCLVRLNRAAAAYLGVNPEEVVGCHCSELRSLKGAFFPVWALTQTLKEGVEVHTEFCADNDHSFLVTVDPFWEADGRLAGAVLVARDITPLKDMHRKFSQTTDFLENLIACAPLGVVCLDPKGNIIRANPQFFQEFGYSPGEVLQRPAAFLFVNESERQQVMAELQENGEVLGRQVLWRHGGGQPVPARLSLRLLKGGDQRHLGAVAVVSNISEEVNLQRQLEQAQRQEAIATLAGGLAHNFNNLLTIILGLVTLMHGKIPPDHPAFADLMDIERQVRAGRDITQKLLSFRRSLDFKMQPLDLNRLVATTADMFGRTRPELVIRQELAPNLPAVEGDPGQIQQVLMNLLINAWQSMPQGGVIVLETRAVQLTDWQDPDWEVKPGSFVCLSVTDSGTGMDEATVARLFEPFFTTKEPGQGSGLGLASAARIMKNHHGAIQVRSRLGEGSTFTLFFPASTARPRAEIPEDTGIIPGQGTILVVDDDPTLRRVARKLLEKLGYRVREAASGEQALQIYAQHQEEIDLVLLDVLMPGLNGLMTMERLRALNPQVRILLVSGIGDTSEENLPQGVEFLTKPFPLGLLSQKVAAALSH